MKVLSKYKTLRFAAGGLNEDVVYNVYFKSDNPKYNDMDGFGNNPPAVYHCTNVFSLLERLEDEIEDDVAIKAVEESEPMDVNALNYGGYMAKGGIYSSDNIYILKISKEGKEVGEERFRARNVKEAKEMGEDYEEKYKTKFGGDLSFSVKEAMSMGGKVTFEDKVSSIKKSLLKTKTVSPKVQKDYGKTYNKKEALESAKRIAGAIKKKYKI